MSSGEHDENLSDLDIEELKSELQEKGKVSCPSRDCNEDFKSIWGLKYHLKKAYIEGKFKCDDCGQGFQTRTKLQQHSRECRVQHSESAGLQDPTDEEKTKQSTKKPRNTKRKLKESGMPENEPEMMPLRRSGRVRTPRKSPVIENPPPKSRKRRKAPETDDEEDDTSNKKKTPQKGKSPQKNIMDDFEGTEEVEVAAQVEVQDGEISELPTETNNEDVNIALEEPETSDRPKPKDKLQKRKPKPKGTKEKIVKKTHINNIENKEMGGDEIHHKQTVRIPKKRGRPRKKVNTEPLEVIDISEETSKDEETETSFNHADVEGTEECGIKETGNELDENNDGDDDSTTERTPKKGKKGRPKQELSLETQIKRQMRYKKTVACPKTCGKKFTSVRGYMMHIQGCGLSLEEKQKFICEECGKAYTTEPGLRYHLNTRHLPIQVEEEQIEENVEDDKEDETPSTKRRQRKSAARAMEKVKELIIEDHRIRSTPTNTKESIIKKESYLDQFIKELRGDVSTPAMKQQWKQQVAKRRQISCPNKDCEKMFSTLEGIKYHFQNCGFDSRSFVCTICNHDFGSRTIARMHMSTDHSEVEENHSKSLFKDEVEVEETLSHSGNEDDEADKDFEIKEADLDEQMEADEEAEDVSGSELNDDVNADDDWDDETLVWSEHFQRFIVKKKRKAARRKRNNAKHEESSLMVKVERIQQLINENTAWRNKFFTKQEVLPRFQPTLAHWSRADTRTIEEFIPTAHVSPLFRINRRAIDQTSTADQQLSLFTGLEKKASSKAGDITFFVGGPVWAMNWCPVPDSESSATQYLFLSTHRSVDGVHQMCEAYEEKGVLQFWDLGELRSTATSSGSTPKFVLGITHEFGPVWQASWCPGGAWQPPDTPTKDGVLPRLGLLALACGDGIVRVISVPYPKTLLKELSGEETRNNSDDQHYLNLMVEARSHVELVPGPLGVTYDRRRGQAFCAEWSPDSAHARIAAGYSDGSVCIWNLQTESPLLKDPDSKNLTSRLSPYLHINAHACAIRCLAWCETDANFIATTCCDKSFKVWNLKSTLAPVHSMRKRGLAREMTWPPYFLHWLYCEDELGPNPPALRMYATRHSTNVHNDRLTIHASPVWSYSYSPLSELSLSTDDIGQIKVGRDKIRHNPPATIFSVHTENIDDSRLTPDVQTNGLNYPNGSVTTDTNGSVTKDTSGSVSKDTNKSVTKETNGRVTNDTNGCVTKGINGRVTKDTNGTVTRDTNGRVTKDTNGSVTKDTNGTVAKDIDGTVAKDTDGTSEQIVGTIRTLGEAAKKCRLVFEDYNFFLFNDNAKCKKTEDITAPYDALNIQAMYKVRWNPNKQAAMWLAMGGAAGLVRVHLAKQLNRGREEAHVIDDADC